MENAMNVVLLDVPWDGGVALQVTIDAGEEKTVMGHLWNIAAKPTTWHYSIEKEFNPNDKGALEFEAANRNVLYEEIIKRIRIMKIPPNRLMDETMHQMTAEILGVLIGVANATRSQQGFLGAIYGAVAKFAVTEIKPDRREEFLQRSVADIRQSFDHYLEIFGVAEQVADTLRDAITKVVRGDDDSSTPVH